MSSQFIRRAVGPPDSFKQWVMTCNTELSSFVNPRRGDRFMDDKSVCKSNERFTVNDDPNYKWRVMAGLGTILFFLIAVVLIVTVSKAQSGESSIFLFGMGITIAIVVVMTLFRYPSETQQPSPTNNPAFVIVVAIIAELIASIVAAVVVHYLKR
jgi:hypothetical protein